ncbi:MAG TPA: hypothetical protein VJA94_10325 [Candidatus Angelobacter sp.]
MLRRVLQLASLASLAGLSLLYPLVESLDSFDSPVPASDLEIEVIVLLTFVGIVFVLAHVLVLLAIFAVLKALRYIGVRLITAVRSTGFAFQPLYAPSPPLALRI